MMQSLEGGGELFNWDDRKQESKWVSMWPVRATELKELSIILFNAFIRLQQLEQKVYLTITNCCAKVKKVGFSDFEKRKL